MKNFKNDMIELLQYRKRYGQACDFHKYDWESGKAFKLQYRKRYGQAFNQRSPKSDLWTLVVTIPQAVRAGLQQFVRSVYESDDFMLQYRKRYGQAFNLLSSK